MARAKPIPLTEKIEWLEPDGLGGYASGTVAGLRTRRYHALLLTATTPPTGRVALVNGFDAWVETGNESTALSCQRYSPDVIAPDGRGRLQSFDDNPWPRWVWKLAPEVTISLELFVPHELSACVLNWSLEGWDGRDPKSSPKLVVRPFLSCRDYHGTTRENNAFCFDARAVPLGVGWKPYASMPSVTALSSGEYRHEPYWYRNFLYTEEQARGLDCVEDLGSPGTFSIDLRGPAVLIFAPDESVDRLSQLGQTATEIANALAASERKRRAIFRNRLARSADAYLVRRGACLTNSGEKKPGRTIIAGYPWFTDWGRDTFIALRGLCLAGGRTNDAADILGAWAGTLSEGMVPNRFPDQSGAPEYNSVDASLWFVVAVDDFLTRSKIAGTPAPADLEQKLRAAVLSILSGYFRGTRYGIRCDTDGLLQAGVPGVQLTWMDVKIGDWVVTPRIGKPVEIEALWLSALRIGGQWDKQWTDVYARGLRAFRDRFWNASRGCLYDVVDADHHPGQLDDSLRPNQLLAIGGLRECLLDEKQARQVVDLVEDRLWTPLGPRTLDPADPAYTPHYQGGMAERDPAYHRGTVWPWLAGPFIEAWLRVRGNTAKSRTEARTRFIDPLISALDLAGLGHLPEIADGGPPHTPRGCPFQAWSVGELMRAMALVDADSG
jgi:predicted glycogen debranching enzyme